VQKYLVLSMKILLLLLANYKNRKTKIMIDLGKQILKNECPNCRRQVSFIANQVANNALVKCTCGQEIQLKDDGSFKKGISDINKAFKDLENTFKRLGK